MERGSQPGISSMSENDNFYLWVWGRKNYISVSECSPCAIVGDLIIQIRKGKLVLATRAQPHRYHHSGYLKVPQNSSLQQGKARSLHFGEGDQDAAHLKCLWKVCFSAWSPLPHLSADRCIAWLRVLIWSCANSSTTSTKTSANQVFKCVGLGESLSFKSPQGSENDQNTFYNIVKGLIKIFLKDTMTCGP